MPPGFLKGIALVMGLAGSAFPYWSCAGLKRVRIDGMTLLVSNFRREIGVPLMAIGRVTEIRWITIHPVTIHLDRPTAFGNVVVFMQALRRFGFLSAHPFVAELEQAARLAKTGRTSA